VMKSKNIGVCKSKQFMSQLAFAGKNVTVFRYALILKPEMVSLFDYVRIDDYSRIEGGAGVILGNNVHFASFSGILGGGKCVIGDHCGIAQGARIITGTERITGYMSAASPMELRDVMKGQITIGRLTFIGSNSVIMPNVTIHDGGVVGAGAVVTKDVAPWTIVAGVPAIKIGERDVIG